MTPVAVENTWVSDSKVDNSAQIKAAANREADLASETSFAGPLWLCEEVGALYAKGEVNTEPFSMPLLRVAKLGCLPKEDRYSILDLCCGSGITTHELQVLFRGQGIKVDLVCGDFSAGQLEYLDKKIERMGWKNTVTRRMDAQKTGQSDKAFDHITCAQNFMILPDSQAALTGIYAPIQRTLVL